MIRKIAALFALALLMAVVPLTSTAHAESYAPKVPTAISVQIVSSTKGAPLEVKFTVSASDGTSPSGNVSYTINGSGPARAQGRGEGGVPVSGDPVRVSGPVAHAGHYGVRASFTPSNTAKYLPSNGSAATGIGSGVPGNGSTPSGGLPNTGGPALGWLIAGFGLAGLGAGAVALSRRRTPHAA